MFYFVGGAKLCPLHVPKSYSSQTKLLENPYALDKSFIFATVMATPSIGKKTDTSRCYDQSAKGAALPYDRNDLSCRLPMNSIAALIREGAEEVSKRQGSKRASTMVQRMINSLQWRQAHSKDEFYPLTFETGTRLRLRQLQAGEVTGLGTGATVWPAAHVLVKYLERRYGEGGMEGLRVLDLGSGTGIAGIAAAALGAAESFLTDQEQLLFLMQENADRNLSECKIPASVMRVFTYNWGMQDDRISSPVDVILISDCVLPKLYPIEPLVNAIHMLSGPETVTIMSYEHRHYPEFDPRRRFEELAAARGLSKTNIPQRDHHPIFSADDIEIWEVSRARRVLDFLRVENEGDGLTAEVKGEIGTSEDYAPVSQGRVDVVTISQSPSDSAVTMATLFGERHELSQALSGAIGCYLWPSGVVMARHLLAATLGATSKGLDGNEDGGTCESARSYPPRARMLELGSGVGLVAMAAALIGWDVLATDRADTVPLLKANIDRFLTSTKRTHGAVDVAEYSWGHDVRGLMTSRSNHDESKSSVAGSTDNGEGFNVVVCADCLYAKSSVEPLLFSLRQVCDETTVVLVTNELRSSFDEFLRAAKSYFAVEDVPLLQEDMVVDPQGNESPKPVALKRLRRLPST